MLNEFRIIQKLGAGGFSTVWFVTNTVLGGYFALKVTAARPSSSGLHSYERVMEHIKHKHQIQEGGEYLGLPSSYFWVIGVNGQHLCLVSKVAGVSIDQMRRGLSTRNNHASLAADVARRIGLQVLQSVAFLHSEEVGVVHGDLTSPNILFELNCSLLDELPITEIIKLLGKPKKEKILPSIEDGSVANAPKHVYLAANMLRFMPYATGNITLIDFGVSTFENNPSLPLATPMSSCPPKFLRDNVVLGKKADIWALGGILWQLRAERQISTRVTGDEEEIIAQIEKVLGLLPDALVPVSVKKDSNEETVTNINLEFEGLRIPPPSRNTTDTKDKKAGNGKEGNLSKLLRNVENGKIKLLVDEDMHHPSYFDSLCTWYDVWISSFSIGGTFMSNPEADVFENLLRKIWKYDTEKRAPASQLLLHPWFSKEFGVYPGRQRIWDRLVGWFGRG